MLISGGVTRTKSGVFLNKKHLVETQGTAISATYHEIGTRLLSSPWCFQCFPVGYQWWLGGSGARPPRFMMPHELATIERDSQLIKEGSLEFEVNP